MTSPGQWERGFPLFALLLIALGVLFLLQTMGVLSWGLWRSIWRLWPLLPIAVGINIIFGRRSPWLSGILIAAVVACVAALAAFTGAFIGNGFRDDTEVIGSFHELLGETERVGVNINFGAGELVLNSLPPGSKNLVEAEFRGREAEGSVIQANGSADLDISTGDFAFDFFRDNDNVSWEVSLSPSPGMSIELDTGAADINLDLRRLRVSDLSIDAGAADIKVVMPAQAGHVNADIDVGASSVVIVIPEEMGARIDVDATVGHLSIDQQRFPKQGEIYASQNFDALANRIDLVIDSGASSVEIR